MRKSEIASSRRGYYEKLVRITITRELEVSAFFDGTNVEFQVSSPRKLKQVFTSGWRSPDNREVPNTFFGAVGSRSLCAIRMLGYFSQNATNLDENSD